MPSRRHSRPTAARSRRRAVLAGLGAVLLTAAVLNLGMGAVEIRPGEVLVLLAERIGLGAGAGAEPVQASVFWSIRLPRLVLALAVGAGLAAAGVGLQGVFRNPLAESQVVGVSWGAAAGAVTAVAAGGAGASPLVPPAAAALGGFAAAMAVYRTARRGRGVEVVTLILAGVAVNAALAALTGLLVNLAAAEGVRSLAFWSLGTLGGATWESVRVTLLFTVPCLALLARRAEDLNVMLLGEEEAGHIGLDPRRLRVEVAALAALLTGAAVSAAGIIGFVGLLAPHTVRLLIGPDNRFLLWGAALAGAALAAGADLAARTAAAPVEIPIGVLTSLAGGPFFLWLLRSTRRAQGGWG